MNFFKERKNAFLYAGSGIFEAFKMETHLRLHVLAALLAVSLGFCFSISKVEWCLILICIALVISLELVNSSIEKLCNEITLQEKTSIKYIKDIAAGAVLVVSIASFIVGLIIFLPYF